MELIWVKFPPKLSLDFLFILFYWTGRVMFLLFIFVHEQVQWLSYEFNYLD